MPQIVHASESTHYYRHDGSPVLSVPSADGKKMIAPDIRHARKYSLVPGYTSVAAVLSRPGLERWKVRQAVLAALTLPRAPGESDIDFLNRLDQDANAWTRKRADEGTAIHKAIEQSLRGEPHDPAWTPQVKAVRALIEMLPNDFIGDFKTKDSLKDKRDSELYFDEYAMQLAAYQHALESRTGALNVEHAFAHASGYGGRVDVSRGAPLTAVSILISVQEPGLVCHKLWNREELARGFSLFEHALGVWKLRNNYDSSFAQ